MFGPAPHRGLGGVALSKWATSARSWARGTSSILHVVVLGAWAAGGAVVAALGLGVVNKLIEPAAGAVLGKILVLVFVILFIQRRPQGLFAIKGRQEA